MRATFTKVINRLYKPNIKQMYESYIMEREKLIQTDYKAYGLPELTDRERIAETKFNIMKQEILTEFSIDDLIDFWSTRDLVKTSRLYDTIKRIPKGATLHIHDSASLEYSWVIDNLMNEPNVYINTRNLHMKVLSSPKYNYIPVSEFLSNKEDGIELIKSRIQFNKVTSKGGPHEIWKKFVEMYLTPGGLINYQPHFKKYLLRSLEDFKNDNVSRVEYRHMLGFLYNLERKLTFDEEICYIKQVVDEFIAHNPGFSVGLIICGYKAEEPEVIAENVIRIYELVKKYPGFVLGYDLVGEEENLRQNIEYTSALLQIKELAREEGKEFPLYLHAGEITMKTLDNVYDAFLLGSKRIGHGISLHRHPFLLSQIIQKQITIECCPLSNYVLGYMKDLRTHPALSYFSQGARVTISSDDPGVFGYSGVTHDFLWVTVLWDLDLAKLKRLILNSIEACPQVEGLREDWEMRWRDFIEYLATYNFIDSNR